MRISKRTTYPKSNGSDRSYLPIMTEICNFLHVLKVSTIERRVYDKNKDLITRYFFEIKTSRKASVNLLIEYLDKNPMFSSKYLDYLDWKTMHITRYDAKLTKTEQYRIFCKLVSNMNTKRTAFCWKHLNKFC
jgi:hypothetical protein